MRKLKFLLLSLVVISCGPQGEDVVNSDEIHRQTDWETQVTGIIQLDTIQDDWNRAQFVEVNSTSSLQELSDLVFESGFTGDAQVYAPDIFGVIDTDTKLDPEQLLEELKITDTTSIEDLVTGELRDTVIDMSFTKERVSAVRIFCRLDEDKNELTPSYTGIGYQVFDEASGAFRGLGFKFYVQVGSQLPKDRLLESLVIKSDSTGVFRADGFMMHEEDSETSFSAYARKLLGPQALQAKCSFLLKYEISTGRISMEDLRLESLEQAL